MSNLIDRDALMETFEGAEEILVSIIQQYMDQQKESLNKIRDALGANDTTQVGFEGHTFKGMVSNFQAEQVTQIAYEVEQAGKEGNLERAKEKFNALEDIVSRFNQELIYLKEEFS